MRKYQVTKDKDGSYSVRYILTKEESHNGQYRGMAIYCTSDKDRATKECEALNNEQVKLARSFFR